MWDKFNVVRISSSVNYLHKWTAKLYLSHNYYFVGLASRRIQIELFGRKLTSLTFFSKLLVKIRI
jgi:hypothetical protein